VRIVILTVGTRGDVQPLVALALGLMDAGHSVRVAAHQEYRELVQGSGVEFVEMPANPTGRWKKGEESVKDFFESHFRQWTVAGLEMAEDAEAIIYAPLALVGYHIAEKLDIPCIAVYLEPAWATREYPTIYLRSQFSLGRTYNLLTHRVGDLAFWLTHRSAINRVRRDLLGLPAIELGGPYRRMERQRVPHLFAYSELVAPRPRDWGDWMHVTGYWFLEQERGWDPAPDLVSFLEAGPRPLYFSMGSLSHPGLRKQFLTVLEALAGTGERVVLDAGKVDLSDVDLPGDVYRLDSATPHSWILPRVTAVVCHGGGNTVAACLRAGAPTTVLSSWGATHYWGRRLHELGAGAPPITLKRLSVERVQAAVGTMLSDSTRQRSAELARQISAERGVDKAVEAFHRHI
jgi:sterol 3beta-glucosyltransferase